MLRGSAVDKHGRILYTKRRLYIQVTFHKYF